MKPPSLLDPTFKYAPALHSDIRKTFERIRREMQPPPPRVFQIKRVEWERK